MLGASLKAIVTRQNLFKIGKYFFHTLSLPAEATRDVGRREEGDRKRDGGLWSG